MATSASRPDTGEDTLLDDRALAGIRAKEVLVGKLRSEELFEQTGHYCGVEHLTLKSQDPLAYESFHTRLLSMVITARETSRKISASPGVREVGESVVALFTPDGDSIALSTGIVIHVHTLSRFIKWMIDHNYEDDPGIHPGDIFVNNDPFVADVHQPDLMTVIPIFHDDELIGWAGSVCHEIEIGGVIGGANMGTTAERFGNGLTVTAERIGQNDEIRRDYWIRAEYNLRTPIYWILDQKALLAACLMVRERVGELVESYGMDYYKQAVRQLIEEGRRGHLERMRIMTVPGRYRNPAFSFHLQEGKEGTSPISHDIMLNIPVEIDIRPDGHMTIDFDGATPQSWTPFNCSIAASDGILLVAMTQFMDYDGRVNDGTYYGLDIKAPLGSCMNPDSHLVSIGGVFSVIMPVFGAWARAMSRSYVARGFKEEVFVGMVTTPFLEGGGINHFGQHAGGQNLEGGAQGSGARGIMDGIDNAYAGWNPESDMGNVEIWEQALPNLYLGRRIIPDNYGWGRFRGGATMASTWVFYKTPSWVGHSTLHSDLMFDNAGMCGGYPAPTAKYHHLVRGSDYKQLAAEGKPLAHAEGDPSNPDVLNLGGAYELVEGYFHKLLRDGDIVQFIYNAGGGYGDPLERDLDLVLPDLENGYMTIGAAERVLKVAAHFLESEDRFEIDRDRTTALRDQERDNRRSRAIPVSEWMETERKRVANHELDPRVLRCYAGSFQISERWATEFIEFWGLEPDYKPEA